MYLLKKLYNFHTDKWDGNTEPSVVAALGHDSGVNGNNLCSTTFGNVFITAYHVPTADARVAFQWGVEAYSTTSAQCGWESYRVSEQRDFK